MTITYKCIKLYKNNSYNNSNNYIYYFSNFFYFNIFFLMEENLDILPKSIASKKNMNEKLKNKKVRNPGIDFIRILAMYGIIINHIIYKSKNKTFINKFKELKLLHVLLFWHNNGFVFISGFIGHKTHKYSNLFYLWIWVCFYSVVIHLFYLKYKPQYVINDKFYYNLFPIIFRRYWFFTAYFGMYLFLPIINKGISYLNKSELKICFLSTLFIFVFWHDIMNPNIDIFLTKSGYSVLWFLIFYITGAYFGEYKIEVLGIKKYYFYLISFLIYIFTSILYYSIYICDKNDLNTDIKHKIIIILKNLLRENYDSNLKAIQSISIILFLLQINYNKFLGQIISSIATLTFGAYLIHDNICIRNDIIKNLFNNKNKNISLFSVYRLCMIKSLLIFIICIIIDYIRYLLFNLIKIRNFCIILDKKIFEILK